MKQPWYDEQMTNEVQLKWMKKRKWKDSGNEYDYVAVQYQKRHVRKVIHAKQKQYYHDLFINISRDSKRLYAEANKLLLRKLKLIQFYILPISLLLEPPQRQFTLYLPSQELTPNSPNLGVSNHLMVMRSGVCSTSHTGLVPSCPPR